MSGKVAAKIQLRQRRKLRLRKRVEGCKDRPRLSVCRSAKHITAQVIDDATGRTLVAIHSFESKGRANKDMCTSLGKELASRCKAASISSVVFDKNGYAYHGRIKAFADGAREGGLQF
jgi:large subunit ribosomal protein L18